MAEYDWEEYQCPFRQGVAQCDVWVCDWPECGCKDHEHQNYYGQKLQRAVRPDA